MGDLNVFVPEERAFLCGIFYKIGIWISHIDDDGDCEADSQEERMLMSVLEKLSQKHAKNTPLISQMTEEAARQTSNHEHWALNASDTAVKDAVKGGHMIKAQMSHDDLRAYKDALGEVAREVAIAFREGEEAEPQGMDKLKGFVQKFTNKSLHEEKNISPREDSALTELYGALQEI